MMLEPTFCTCIHQGFCDNDARITRIHKVFCKNSARILATTTRPELSHGRVAAACGLLGRLGGGLARGGRLGGLSGVRLLGGLAGGLVGGQAGGVLVRAELCRRWFALLVVLLVLFLGKLPGLMFMMHKYD